MPVMLLGATIFFWGWQTGMWFLALPIAFILEAANWLPYRWDFSASDLRRIANFCLIILCCLLAYLLVTNRSIFNNRSIYVIYILLQWLPAVFFPLVAAQLYSVNESLDIRMIFSWLNKGTKKALLNPLMVNLTYPYFICCVLSASTSNSREISFYPGMFILTAIALQSVRSQRFSSILWIGLMLIAGSIGFIGQMGLHQLHLVVEKQAISWLSNMNSQQTDSLQKHTNIGEVGLLKQSNEIIFRVASEAKQTPPRLLREATYNRYKSSTWIALNPNFVPIQPQINGTTWDLADKLPNSSRITIAAALQGGGGLLKLPDGTFQIDALPVSQMEKNQYGTVKVMGKVERPVYKTYFNNNFSLDSPPTEDDLQIPKSEIVALNTIISQLNIQGKSQPEILDRIEWFFLKNFVYSLKLAGQDNDATPMSTFLLQSRTGHCEYFATAAALLLRKLGIPARYAVGYSVHEFSSLENQYIVRSRHAHAWTLAYVAGKWQAFDTTPSDWTSIEDSAAPQLAFISDLWSLLSFKTWLWLRYLSDGDNGLKYGGGMLLAVIFFLTCNPKFKKNFRFSPKKRRWLKAIYKKDSLSPKSNFYLIEQALNELGLIRHSSESFKNWIERLKEEQPELYLLDELTLLIEIHYCDRFDPEGIQEAQKAEFKLAIKSWLNRYRTQAIASNSLVNKSGKSTI
ncbi:MULTISPECIES: transglutaminase-like domain-containing protein [unclassified Microcoleus]|uniref:transglutaminase-like domain-containing protein n=1 Tax=unclassified Microcoleus TaxID=2642155 RepID=UPI002FD5DAA1